MRAGRLKNLDDAELVALCNDAECNEAERAFQLLYLRHKDFVLRTAIGILNDPGLALDALQDTFSFVLRQFPPSGPGLQLTAKMTTYLYPIARNSAISQWRKTARTLPNDRVDPDTLPAPPPTGNDDLDRVLRELSFERREVITLRFLRGLSLAEIAETLDLPLGTVKSRLHAAIQQLRKSRKIKQFFEK